MITSVRGNIRATAQSFVLSVIAVGIVMLAWQTAH
jgi:hypothetical protein